MANVKAVLHETGRHPDDQEGVAVVDHRPAGFATLEQSQPLQLGHGLDVEAGSSGQLVQADAHGTEGGTPGREPGDDAPSDPEAVQTPVRSAHNDYTERSGPQRVVDLMGEQEAKTLLRHRYAIINVWKPIHGPVKQVPLAFCDARSIGSGQLLDTDLVYPDRT